MRGDSVSKQRGAYRFTLLALVLLCLLLLSAVFLVTDHGGYSLSHWISSFSASGSDPPSWLEVMRGREVTPPSPDAFAPSPAPLPAPLGIVKPSVSVRHERVDPDLRRIELSLSRSRASIMKFHRDTNRNMHLPDPDYVPKGSIYKNAKMFHRSYLEMERNFKVYIYEEGEPPLFHDGPCMSIYSTEGRFIHNLETYTRIRTRDPYNAHVHFLPFSIVKLVKFLRDPNLRDIKMMKNTVADYVDLISHRYPFWNRSVGSDHFMVSCHDWAPMTSSAVPELFENSIRVLCNANISEGFNPSKDVSLPEMNLRSDTTTGIIGTAPNASQRKVLAFFAGGAHGPIRPVLIKHWKDKDADLQVYEYLPKRLSYYEMMKKSKFCLCPSGYEVASPRVVEAIYLECVPVIMSDHYVLPFSDVLNWKAFSVQVDTEDIPNLKSILMAIPQEKYIILQRNLKMVQRHFLISTPPKRYDMFHMLLHSVWLRRMNIRIHTLEYS